MAAMDARRAWGARAPRGSYARLSSTRGVKVHYTGGRVDPATLRDHAKCRGAVRGIQTGHMDGNGWMDIGYSMWVCTHTFGVGRGVHVVPAANGPGLNSGHYAVLVLVGTSGVVEPTDAMLRNFHAARDYLRRQGAAGPDIKGHRDGYATSCPGDPLYRWVRAGAPMPGGPVPAPPPPQEDDMPLSDADIKKIANEVYARFSHEVTADLWAAKQGILDVGQKIEPKTAFRQIWAYGKDGYQRHREVLARIDAQDVAIRALAGVLAQRDDEIDVEALLARIREELGRVVVRLEVGDATP